MKRTRRDTIRVGIFVLFAGAVLAGGLLWIAGSRILRPVDTYTIVFDRSVSGLYPGANVQYQGVVVGRVRDIRLTGDLPPMVAVIVDVEPGTPMRTDTVAELLGSIVSGIKYIQFRGGTEAELAPGGTIRGAVPSMEQFSDKMTEITNRVADILRGLQENVFTSDNGTKVNALVTDLSEVAKSLNLATQTFRTGETTKELADVVRKISELTSNVNKIVLDFYGRREPLFGSLESAVRQLDQGLAETRELIRGTQSQVGTTGTSISTLIEQLTAATNRLEETLDVVRSDPSILLWGRSVPEREFER